MSNQDVPEVSPQEAFDHVQDGAFLLDVRRPDEWAESHVPGATHIPLDQLPDRTGELPAGQQIIVMCRSGGRSAQATSFLREQGIDAVNMAGGILEWTHQELPVEEG